MHGFGRQAESSKELNNTTLEVVMLNRQTRSRAPARERKEMLCWHSGCGE